MIVAYCVSCLPSKVVLGYSDKAVNLQAAHDAHEQTKRNGFFPISYKEWKAVEVRDGDGVVDEAATKANIVSQCGGKFV